MLTPLVVSRNKPGLRSINIAIRIRIFCQINLAVAIVIITWLALTPSPPEGAGFSWDKANHSAAFFVLGCLAYYSLLKREWIGWLALATYGVAIEILQWHLGYRFFELWDIIANLLGLIACILCQPILLRLPVLRLAKDVSARSIAKTN